MNHRVTSSDYPLSPTGVRRPCRLLTIDTYRSVFRSPHRITPDHRSRQAAQASRAVSAREVNERYRQHPATGSFAVETEGEITHWDKFAAHVAYRGTGAAGTCGVRATAGAGARRAAIRWPHHRVVSGTAWCWGASATARQRGARPGERTTGTRGRLHATTARRCSQHGGTSGSRGRRRIPRLRPRTPQRHRSHTPRTRRRPPSSPTSRLSTRAHGGRSGPPACRQEVGHEGQ